MGWEARLRAATIIPPYAGTKHGNPVSCSTIRRHKSRNGGRPAQDTPVVVEKGHERRISAQKRTNIHRKSG